MTTTPTAADLFHAAIAADDAFSAAVTAAFPGATRWTVTPGQMQEPSIAAAFARKLGADAAWHRHIESLRASEQ